MNKQKVKEINSYNNMNVQTLEAVHTQCACSAFNI